MTELQVCMEFMLCQSIPIFGGLSWAIWLIAGLVNPRRLDVECYSIQEVLVFDSWKFSGNRESHAVLGFLTFPVYQWSTALCPTFFSKRLLKIFTAWNACLSEGAASTNWL